jgi:hypothetical protein
MYVLPLLMKCILHLLAKNKSRFGKKLDKTIGSMWLKEK